MRNRPPLRLPVDTVGRGVRTAPPDGRLRLLCRYHRPRKARRGRCPVARNGEVVRPFVRHHRPQQIHTRHLRRPAPVPQTGDIRRGSHRLEDIPRHPRLRRPAADPRRVAAHRTRRRNGSHWRPLGHTDRELVVLERLVPHPDQGCRSDARLRAEDRRDMPPDAARPSASTSHRSPAYPRGT